MNYWDKHSRLHHKEVTEANPYPSGNGWIYTSYAEKAGLPMNYEALEHAFIECSVPVLKRNPGSMNVPISRDEILGMASLGMLAPGHLKGWNFSPYPIPRFSPLKLAQQLWQLRPRYELAYNYENDLEKQWVFKHRNYFWQNNLDQLYRFAFAVPLVDRAFILEKWGKENYFYSAIAYLDSKLGQASGIGFLKYGGKKNEEAMRTEFPEGHPLRPATNPLAKK